MFDIIGKYTKLHWLLFLGNQITSDVSLYFSAFSNVATLNNFINLGGGRHCYSIKDMS